MLKNNRSVILSPDELSLQFNTSHFQLSENVKNEECENFATKIIKSKRIKKFTITLLGTALYFKDVYAATKGIDSLGWTLLGLIRHWAYWILLIMCIVEIIKSGLNGESKKTFPILMKFLVIFASMYLVPALFDAIKNAF